MLAGRDIHAWNIDADGKILLRIHRQRNAIARNGATGRDRDGRLTIERYRHEKSGRNARRIIG